ncbi:hypothetical protein ACN469_26990 [Corallococcus terminator]
MRATLSGRAWGGVNQGGGTGGAAGFHGGGESAQFLRPVEVSRNFCVSLPMCAALARSI